MRSRIMMTTALLAAVVFFAAPGPVHAQEVTDKDQQIAELTERVAELERRLTDLEAKALPLIEQAAAQQRRDKARAAARARMRQDRGKYSPEVLGEVEELYQTANKNWRSPGAVAALEKLVSEYPDLNRTGCATMYLGQMTQGAEKVEYLNRAMDDFADCYYGDGVNVGAYATYYLACYHWQEGNYDYAKLLIDKINNQHADAIDHRGRALTDLLKELRPAVVAPHEQTDEVTAP
jgi:cell division protein FtsB